MSTTKSNWVEEVGAPAYAALVERVAALECDYDRLEELGTEYTNNLIDKLIETPEATELVELREAAGECASREEAEQRIHEDALSVEVRSGWYIPDGDCPDDSAAEFQILLTTGGPAVRIMGELSDREPWRAWLEVQDWGKPWTQYFKANQDILLAYASCFYFGEG